MYGSTGFFEQTLDPGSFGIRSPRPTPGRAWIRAAAMSSGPASIDGLLKMVIKMNISSDNFLLEAAAVGRGESVLFSAPGLTLHSFRLGFQTLILRVLPGPVRQDLGDRRKRPNLHHKGMCSSQITFSTLSFVGTRHDHPMREDLLTRNRSQESTKGFHR